MTLHIANVSSASTGVEAAETAARDRGADGASSAEAQSFKASFHPQPDAAGAGDRPVVVVTSGPAEGPMGALSNGVMDAVQSVADRREAMTSGGAPSADDAVTAARDSLLPGPATLAPSTANGPAQPSDSQPSMLSPREAIGVLAETFDYAVETHVVVKSVGQFSNSANALLKTQ